MIIRYQPGSTTPSVYFRIYKDSGKKNTTPLVYNSPGLAASYQRDNATATSITLVALASASAAYSSGGFVYCGAGWYRLDPPPAAVATGATFVIIQIAEATDINADDPLILLDALISSRLASTDTRLPASAAAGATGGLSLVGSQMDLVNAPNATAIAAIQSGLSTFAPNATFYSNLQAAFIDETDGQQVLAAIVNKINATDVNLAGLSVAAIASAVWLYTTRSLTDKDGFGVTRLAGITLDTSFANAGGKSINARPVKLDDSAYVPLDTSTLPTYAPAPTAVQNRQEMDTNSTKLETIRTGLGYTGAGSDNAKAAVAGVASGGGGSVYVEPIVATFDNPISVGKDILIFKDSAPSRSLTIVDATGTPVNLTSKQLRFVIASAPASDNEWSDSHTYTAIAQYDTTTPTDASAIVLSGTGHNVVTITPKLANTMTTGTFRFFLWSITDNVVLAAGKMKVLASAKAVVA